MKYATTVGTNRYLTTLKVCHMFDTWPWTPIDPLVATPMPTSLTRPQSGTRQYRADFIANVTLNTV